MIIFLSCYHSTNHTRATGSPRDLRTTAQSRTTRNQLYENHKNCKNSSLRIQQPLTAQTPQAARAVRGACIRRVKNFAKLRKKSHEISEKPQREIRIIGLIYRKIPMISPWAYICSKGCFAGLIFGGAYFRSGSLFEGILRFKKQTLRKRPKTD